jgi:SAM-dependent methyltransferase
MHPRLVLQHCLCCGDDNLQFTSVLWESLINEWQLSQQEAEYIDLQQGFHCASCGNNLRSMVLAKAIMCCFGFSGWFKDFVRQNIRKIRVLEINTAGLLTQFLKQMPGHSLCAYPEIDMTNLPYENDSFDLVIHSDTLEHINVPTAGLRECYRVLKHGGFCCFTVPLVVDRLSRSRNDLPPSYHSSPGQPQAYNLVYTEFGSDVWKYLFQAGFEECRIYSVSFPTAQALVGKK